MLRGENVEKSVVSPKKVSKKRVQRCKRQKPAPNTRESFVGDIVPLILPERHEEHTVVGAQLRKRRREMDNDNISSFNSSVIAIAALSAVSIINSVSKKKQPPTTNNKKQSIQQDQSPKQSNNTHPGWELALTRLDKTGFSLSPSQPITPSDGNCMFHSLSDQICMLDDNSQFKSHVEVRHAVVSNFLEMLNKEVIIWMDEEPMIDWLDRMQVEGTFGDEYCLQIFSNLVRRDIIYIPVHQSSAHIMKQYCLVRCQEPVGLKPITLLWFEETKFEAGHYQSIIPKSGSLVMRHHQNGLRSSGTKLINAL